MMPRRVLTEMQSQIFDDIDTSISQCWENVL